MITLSDAIAQAHEVLEVVETARSGAVKDGQRWWMLFSAAENLRKAIDDMQLANMNGEKRPTVEFSEGAGHD